MTKLGWGIAALALTLNPVLGSVNIDVLTSTDRTTAASTVTSPFFSTSAGNELLLAFIAADYLSGSNTTANSVSGAGLNWALVSRSNGQPGSSEIWRAFAPSVLSNVTATATLSQSVISSITVVSFTGVDRTGTNGSGAIGATAISSGASGAPAASLVTTRANSLVFGVGNDFDRPIARTAGVGQSLVHQFLAPVGDTYWVQRQTNPIVLAGTTVSINDTLPTGDHYNLSICEILPAISGGATWTVSGAVSPASSGSGTLITASQNGTPIATATANTSGNYTILGLANGAYKLTPSKAGFTFTPVSQPVTVPVNGTNATGLNFQATASQALWTLSGTITPTSYGAGTLVTVSLNGLTVATATADAAGRFSAGGLSNGTFLVTPTKGGYTFNPANRSVTITGANSTGVNFTATVVQTWSISGTVSPPIDGAGSILILSGTASGYATANGAGAFSFTGLPGGTYKVTATKAEYTFSPGFVNVPLNGQNVPGVNFTALAGSPQSMNYPDLSDIIPPGQISVVGTGSARVLQYTHDTLNGGTGPLEILPVYHAASGNYQGFQHIYSLDAFGNWTIARTIPVAGAFVFDSSHGHFHFPFAGYGLYVSNPDGSIGALVAASTKVGFCIDDSFLFDSWLPNAGAFSNWGTCSDPTSLRGLSVGAVDEYDKTDEGQSISLAAVPDGTYWLKAVVDPNNYLAESDETNNETDVQLVITGNTVQILQLVRPALPPPPNVTLTSPSTGAILSNVVQLAATTTVSSASGMQFLVDGLPFRSVVSAQPYVLPWDTRSVLNGTHWVAAQLKDSAGRVGTSSVTSVTVSNGTGTKPPTVQITDPTAGATVDAVISVAATAAAQVGIPTVQFYVDNIPIGIPLTPPPFTTFWNTETSTFGAHVLTASAVGSGGLVGNSTPVSVNVDNSRPAKLIGKDATVFIDGQGTMTTPAFSTTVQRDLLVAFVGYDGPNNSPQTTTVSGAGLVWTLLKRSNSQSGTSETWAAIAPEVLSNVTVLAQPGVGSYHGSMTVIAFTNASGPGIVGQASAASGAPDVYLPGVSAGNWVFAVGNDWDGSAARTPVSGQVLVHQRLDTSTGDTFWVQSTVGPSTAKGLVDIHDSAPTNHRWNYVAVEIVAMH